MGKIGINYNQRQLKPMSLDLSKNACSHCNFLPFCMVDTDKASVSKLVTNSRKLARNEMLCVRNNKFQSLFAIEKGAVKAYQVDSHGREHIRSFYFAGEVLGYRAIHTGFYISSVVALTNTVVCEVPYENFLALLKTNPDLHQHILALISKQLAACSYVDAASAEQRLTAFIIDVTKRLHDPQSRFVKLPMSRQDIGNYLGLTAETISRVFTRLQNEGVLRIDGKSVQIQDYTRLRQLAE